MRFLVVAFLLVQGCKSPSKPPSIAVEKMSPAQSVAPKTNALPPKAAANDPLPNVKSEQYYGVYLTGQKAGWAREMVTRTKDGGVRVTTSVNLRIKRLNAELTMSITDMSEYAPLPDGGLREFSVTERSAGKVQTLRTGKLNGDRFSIQVETGGNTQRKETAAPRENLKMALPQLLAARLQKNKGGPLIGWQFDRQSHEDRKLEISLLDSKQTQIHGGAVTLLTVQQLDVVRGVKMVSRMTGAGRILEMSMGPGLKLVLEDRDIAMNPSAILPDLYQRSVVPIDKKLGSAAKVYELELEMDGLPSTFNLNDQRQVQNGAVLKIQRRPMKELKAIQLTEAERKKWLEKSAFVDHGHPSIVALSKTFGLQKNAEQRVRNMTAGVHQRIKYTLSTAPPTASAILKVGEGDCTEYAMLLVALARAAGLPARVVSGMAYTGDSDPGFAFHAWAEVYVNGVWLAADPTWNQVPIDATHIAISRDDPTPIVALLGGLKTRVKSVSTRP